MTMKGEVKTPKQAPFMHRQRRSEVIVLMAWERYPHPLYRIDMCIGPSTLLNQCLQPPTRFSLLRMKLTSTSRQVICRTTNMTSYGRQELYFNRYRRQIELSLNYVLCTLYNELTNDGSVRS